MDEYPKILIHFYDKNWELFTVFLLFYFSAETKITGIFFRDDPLPRGCRRNMIDHQLRISRWRSTVN